MFRFVVVFALLAAASAFVAPGRRAPRTNSVKVNEDFGLFGFEKEWENEFDVLSEARLEKALNDKGVRYRMNRTDKENDERELMDLPSFKLGPIVINAPKVGSIWEALGFTATGINDASKKAKEEWRSGLKNYKYKNARFSKEEREEWRNKYGYER
mmetsp:Transcript_39987/g.125150  ORF Transcript_39987/g.125150 Transcript_39987/m.125150 type:complete len:156 (+) Transcript_39987:86-553(+)